MSALALERRHLFSVEEWLKMGEAGLFAPDYRGELIDGEIWDMPPIGPTHGGCVNWLGRFFSEKIAPHCLVSIQNPLRLGDLSAPQPDVALLKLRDDLYRTAHPGPEDVLLVVEVADTTVRQDREVKAPLYARFGIAEYWLVNLLDQCVEVYRQPQTTGYRSITRCQRNGRLSPVAFPDLVVEIQELLG